MNTENQLPQLPRRIWDGTPNGYQPIEDDPDVLWGQQRIHTSPETAAVELRAVLRKRETDMPFCRGVAVHCLGDGCSNVLFLESQSDLYAFREGSFVCSACKELAFASLPPFEKQRRRDETTQFWNDFVKTINAI